MSATLLADEEYRRLVETSAVLEEKGMKPSDLGSVFRPLSIRKLT